jgi:hypothetical protein
MYLAGNSAIITPHQGVIHISPIFKDVFIKFQGVMAEAIFKLSK